MKINTRSILICLILTVLLVGGCSKKDRKPDIVSLTPEEEEFAKKSLEKTRNDNQRTSVPSKVNLPPMVQISAVYPPALTRNIAGSFNQDQGQSGILYVYSDKGSKNNHFIPSGWMGDYSDVTFSDDHIINPYSGSCIKISYSNKASGGARWAGIYWQDPANNWGTTPSGGLDLTGKQRLTFWAKGENGGECIKEFKMGGISGAYPDSTSASIGPVYLTKDWKQYKINLSGKNLKHVIGGFAWATNLDVNPKGCTFYLDEIKYE